MATEFFTNERKSNAETETLAPPPKININHLKENGLLFTDSDIAGLRIYRDAHPEVVKLSRKDPEFGLAFSVLFVLEAGVEKMFALYRDRDLPKDESLVGKSGFSQVRFGQDLDTGEWVAIKIPVDEENEQVVNETSMLKYLNYLKGKAIRQSKKNIKRYVIQTLFRGTHIYAATKKEKFQDLANADRELELVKLIGIAIKTLGSVEKLHEKGIAHQDLNGKNILFDSHRDHVLLIDFGRSFKLRNKFAEDISREEDCQKDLLEKRLAANLARQAELKKEIKEIDDIKRELADIPSKFKAIAERRKKIEVVAGEDKARKEGEKLSDEHYALHERGIQLNKKLFMLAGSSQRDALDKIELKIMNDQEDLRNKSYMQPPDETLKKKDFCTCLHVFYRILSGNEPDSNYCSVSFLFDMYQSKTRPALNEFFDRFASKKKANYKGTEKQELQAIYDSLERECSPTIKR